jgi:hypothetical protein
MTIISKIDREVPQQWHFCLIVQRSLVRLNTTMEPNQCQTTDRKDTYTHGKTPLMEVQDGQISSEHIYVDETTSNKKHTSGSLGWWTEIGNLLLSTAIFIAIIVLLRRFDGKLQPKWQWDFNLNALIAILATFLRVSMMEAVTNCECTALVSMRSKLIRT